MNEFKLNFRLLEDSTFVTKLNVSQVRLNHDARFPWLILIPEIAGLKELHDIPDQKQAIVQKEVNFCSAALQELASADKMNVAALGNLVPQLHIHVIARKHDDSAWPKPVWSAGEAKPMKKNLAGWSINSGNAAINQVLNLVDEHGHCNPCERQVDQRSDTTTQIG